MLYWCKVGSALSCDYNSHLQHQVAYIRAVEIKLEPLAILGAGRNLQGHLARASDDSSPTITAGTEAQPFIGAAALFALGITRHPQRNAAPEARLLNI